MPAAARVVIIRTNVVEFSFECINAILFFNMSCILDSSSVGIDKMFLCYDTIFVTS